MAINTEIPGWMHEADLLALETLARMVPENGVVIEVGAFLGRSTWMWSKTIPATAELHVVDDWAWMPTEDQYGPNLPGYPLDRSKSPRELFEHYTADCSNITPYQGQSWEIEIPELKDRKADLLFLDAGHGEFDVKRDVMHWLDYIDTERTILCGDDYWSGDWHTPPQWPGIVGMVHWLADHRMKRPVRSLGNKIWAILPESMEAGEVQ